MRRGTTAGGASGGGCGGGGSTAANRPTTTAPIPRTTTILITGCSEGGIGYALARELSSRPGILVIATARRLDAMRGLGGGDDGDGSGTTNAASCSSCRLLPLDVSDSVSLKECVAEVDALTQGRGLDALVNNAGATVQGALLDVPVDAARRVFDVNVLGGLAAAQAFAPAMVARGEGGLIANVGSAAGYASLPLKAVYSATKHAVRVLSDALRVELAPFGVRVLLVAPGYVRTAIDERSRGQGGWFAPAYGLSPYALYSKARAVVTSSIFDEGSLAGGKSLPVGVFARRLADALLRELEGARRVAAFSAGGLAAGSGSAASAAAPLELAGYPTTPASRARMASPPTAAELLLRSPRAWLPAALGGPLRHLRLGPGAAAAWISSALLPLWLSDLVFGLKMGLWQVRREEVFSRGVGSRGGGGGFGVGAGKGGSGRVTAAVAAVVVSSAGGSKV